MKPPAKGTSIGFHQDSWYISDQFVPRENNSITCWIPLDDVDETVGTIEYISGSHLWNNPKASTPNITEGFHGSSEDYRGTSAALAAQASTGMSLSDLENKGDVVKITLPAGGISFHHQNTWHGSGPNLHDTNWRRVIVSHLIRGDVRFDTKKDTTYIYGRYRMEHDELHEKFFPTVYKQGQ
jgi:ectoine hydroxylase-related dioxygenase (phytanoyl-CoA dioxygenase family)